MNPRCLSKPNRRRLEACGRESVPMQGTWEGHKAVLDSHQPFRDFEYRLVTYVGDPSVFRISGPSIREVLAFPFADA